MSDLKQHAVFELLTPDLQGPFEMIWVELGAGVPEPETYQHAGTECVLLVEGQLVFHLGALSYRLEPGDSITFPGHLPHRAENPGPALAKLAEFDPGASPTGPADHTLQPEPSIFRRHGVR